MNPDVSNEGGVQMEERDNLSLVIVLWDKDDEKLQQSSRDESTATLLKM